MSRCFKLKCRCLCNAGLYPRHGVILRGAKLSQPFHQCCHNKYGSIAPLLSHLRNSTEVLQGMVVRRRFQLQVKRRFQKSKCIHPVNMLVSATGSC